jgi:mono/diheme cytochrome c family protein
MRWGRVLSWGLGSAALALAAALAVLLLGPPPLSPRGPEPGRSLFRAHCAGCHGGDGRGGTWRTRLLFLRPGDLTRSEMASLGDRYLEDLIRQGGASYGKPGMPGFGFELTEGEIQALVRYLRVLPRAPRDVG